jgi:hypothetical protein
MAGSLPTPSSYPVPVDRLFILHAQQDTVDVCRAITKILDSAEYSVAVEIRKDKDGSIEICRVHREQKFRQQKGK